MIDESSAGAGRPAGAAVARVLLGAAAVLASVAALIAATGGIDLRVAEVPIRARSWQRPAALAAVCAAPALLLLRHRIRGALSNGVSIAAAERAGRRLVLLAIVWSAAAALIFGTYVPGGADSYGYVSQAELLARGRLTDVVPTSPSFTWRDVGPTLTPLGFVPRGAGVIAPQYPPGLPLLMAPLARIDRTAVFLLVPCCAAIAVWVCWGFGRALGDPLAGALAAALLAVSPTFLYQAVQPMSDVPVAACWLGALLLAPRGRRRSAAAAGALGGLAILIRPNLAPLLLLVAAAAATTSSRPNLRRAVAVIGAAVPFVLALGIIQSHRYGSPLASGYGPFGDLFSLAFVGPNLARYPRWLVETHTWFIAVWIAAPLWIRRVAPERRRLAWIAYAFCIAVCAAYLPYVYFQPQEWFYTRFLLPAIPLMLLFGTKAALEVLRAVSPSRAAAAAMILTLALGAVFLRNAAAAGAFALQTAERKYPDAGRFIRDRLPQTGLVLARQHSGSVRYYAGRPTLRWDVLHPGELDRALADLRRAGYTPFAVLDADEYVEFRARFAGAAEAPASMTVLGTFGRTRVFGFDAAAQ